MHTLFYSLLIKINRMSLKEIQNKLLLWEAAETPLAPLTPSQREAILDLENLLHSDEELEVLFRPLCSIILTVFQNFSIASIFNLSSIKLYYISFEFLLKFLCGTDYRVFLFRNVNK